MSIITFRYLLFIAAVFVLYYLMPLKVRWTVLLVASVCYLYIGEGLRRGFLFACTLGFTWLMALLVKKTGKKIFLYLGIIVDIGLWLFLKEGSFFTSNLKLLNRMAGTTFSYPEMDAYAPIGISYYTLMLVGYLCDVSWGILEPEKNPFKFAALGGYFPLFTAGPIIHYRKIKDDFFAGQRFRYENLCYGAQRILWGFLKKLVIAERAAVIVNRIWSEPGNYPGLYVWIGVLLFVIELYADFSGCIDIVMGTSQLFGIILPENFNLPFLSQSVSEFWRRWHITLGAWLKEYILNPLLKSGLWQKLNGWCRKRFGKKWGKKIYVWCGLLVSWLFIGLWHGGSYNYILGVGVFYWGCVVFSELTGEFFQKAVKKIGLKEETFSYRLFRACRTLFLFMVSSIFWRSVSFRDGIRMLRSALSTVNPWILFDGSFLNMGLTAEDWHILRLGILLMAAAGIISVYKKKPAKEWIAEQNLVFRWMVWIGLFVFVLIYGKYGPGYDAAEFIYRGF